MRMVVRKRDAQGSDWAERDSRNGYAPFGGYQYRLAEAPTPRP